MCRRTRSRWQCWRRIGIGRANKPSHDHRREPSLLTPRRGRRARNRWSGRLPVAIDEQCVSGVVGDERRSVLGAGGSGRTLRADLGAREQRIAASLGARQRTSERRHWRGPRLQALAPYVGARRRSGWSSLRWDSSSVFVANRNSQNGHWWTLKLPPPRRRVYAEPARSNKTSAQSRDLATALTSPRHVNEKTGAQHARHPNAHRASRRAPPTT